jgi:hypothetical protein
VGVVAVVAVCDDDTAIGGAGSVVGANGAVSDSGGGRIVSGTIAGESTASDTVGDDTAPMEALIGVSSMSISMAGDAAEGSLAADAELTVSWRVVVVVAELGCEEAVEASFVTSAIGAIVFACGEGADVITGVTAASKDWRGSGSSSSKSET